MDDIIEKLHLLDYMGKFCRQKQKRPLSRTYFALKQANEPVDQKIKTFCELCYWLMNLA